MREYATFPFNCPRCGNEITAHIRVAVRLDQIDWASSMSCTKCGFAEEADGMAPSDEERSAVLRVNGEWVCSITSLGRSPLRVIRMLSEHLGKSPEEVKSFLPSVASGTRTEMTHLYEQAIAQGAEGNVLPALKNPHRDQ